ncbi:MAG: metallophosphoesterase [Clostridia bacterium]|nr:metallophosphoesterase [Clostridia bacterium]
MKIFAISDFHLSINNPKPMDIFGEVWDGYLEKIEKFWKENITDDDIVLIAGDLSWAMTLDEFKPDLEYLGSLKGKKFLLRGNHDYYWHSISALRNILPYNTFAVQNDCIRCGNVLVCGTRGWTTTENGVYSDEDKKIYEREKIRLKLSLDDMKKQRRDGDIVMVMMHYPPFNSKFERSAFTDIIDEYDVNAVVYGHLHGKNARCKKIVNINDTNYYLTSCDMVDNEPQLIYTDGEN